MNDRERAALADEIERELDDASTFLTNGIYSKAVFLPPGQWANLIAFLRAEERAAREWRPIATAPRDGTDILAIENFCREGHGGKTYPKEALVVKWSELNQGWVCFGVIVSSFEPTHWQPLPPAPRALPDEEPQP
jgi:hypothetical protein